MAIFRAKNTLLREEHGQMARAKRHFLPGHVWHSILRTGVIKKNFCLNLPEIDADGCNGCLRQRSVTESVCSTIRLLQTIVAGRITINSWNLWINFVFDCCQVAYGSIFSIEIEAINSLAITMKSKIRFIAEQPCLGQIDITNQGTYGIEESIAREHTGKIAIMPQRSNPACI